jgi:hypothetical protein
MRVRILAGALVSALAAAAPAAAHPRLVVYLEGSSASAPQPVPALNRIDVG